MGPSHRHTNGSPAGLALVAATLTLALAGCQGTETPPSAGVVAADGVLCDLTRTLAGDGLRVDCLLNPGEDPHALRLTPDQKRRLQKARLVLVNGYGLTPALADWPGAEAVAEAAVPDALRLEGDDHGHHDPQGDSHHAHGDRDAHVWHDPANAAAMVRWIARRLETLEPARTPAITRRATAMEEVLADLDRWNRRQLAGVPRPSPGERPSLATGHRAFASLAAAYDLDELAVVDAHSNAESLRPEGLRGAVDELRRRRVRSLFSETIPPPRTLQRISDLAAVPIAPTPLVADGLLPAGESPATLPGTLVANTCTIVRGLGGACDQAGGERLVRRWQAIGDADRPD